MGMRGGGTVKVVVMRCDGGGGEEVRNVMTNAGKMCFLSKHCLSCMHYTTSRA